MSEVKSLNQLKQDVAYSISLSSKLLNIPPLLSIWKMLRCMQEDLSFDASGVEWWGIDMNERYTSWSRVQRSMFECLYRAGIRAGLDFSEEECRNNPHTVTHEQIALPPPASEYMEKLTLFIGQDKSLKPLTENEYLIEQIMALPPAQRLDFGIKYEEAIRKRQFDDQEYSTNPEAFAEFNGIFCGVSIYEEAERLIAEAQGGTILDANQISKIDYAFRALRMKVEESDQTRRAGFQRAYEALAIEDDGGYRWKWLIGGIENLKRQIKELKEKLK